MRKNHLHVFFSLVCAILTIQLSRWLLSRQYRIHGTQRPLNDVMHTQFFWNHRDLFAEISSKMVAFLSLSVLWFCRSGAAQNLVPRICVMYAFRAVCNVVTLMPPPISCRQNTNVIIDFGREANNCGDLMFSGHQAFSVLLLLWLRERQLIGTETVWAISILQGGFTTISHNHYSIDVIVATMASYIINSQF